MQPTVGRIVHYFDGVNPEPWAAIITNVWSPVCVNLNVFADGTRGGPGNHIPTSVVMADAPAWSPACWRWPPRADETKPADVPDAAAPVGTNTADDGTPVEELGGQSGGA